MTTAATPSTDPIPDPGRMRPAGRALCLSGAAFVALVLVGNSLAESVVGDDRSPEGTVRDLRAQAGSAVARAGFALELVAMLLLALFAAVVTSLVARRSGATVPGVLVAVSAGLFLAVKVASAGDVLAALENAETLPADVLHGLVASNGAAFVVSWLPYAVMVGAMALALARARLLGRHAAGAGLLLATAGVVAGLVAVVQPSAAVPVPFLLSLLWTGGVGLRLALKDSPVPK